MAAHKNDGWTYAIITAITLVIWLWAAGETRQTGKRNVRVEFVVPDAAEWVVNPATSSTVSVTWQGSQRAVRKAEQISELRVELPVESGPTTVDLETAIRTHPLILETGVAIDSVDPASLQLQLDKIIEVSAPVRLGPLPGIDTTDAPVVEPNEVTVRLPSRRMEGIDQLIVDATVAPEDLVALDPGMPYSFSRVPVKLPAPIAGSKLAQVRPGYVNVSFTVRSNTRDVVPPVPVPVKVMVSPADNYRIVCEPPQIRDVTLRVTDDLATRIESGEVPVVAALVLKSIELDQGIQRKAITAFFATLPNGELVRVPATIRGSTEAPEIALTIERIE